ncbi:MAG: class I SAM-dependent methyltransferase [Ignavibacteriales bacterium]|nr:class I SAM-dependent methyltransferase [Ignavibacteriales bacterium]
MKDIKDYLKVNRQGWNKRTPYHVKSDFYDVKNFIKGKSSLNEIEINLLGNIKGKSLLHLQCHFGQDTISLGRMGAKVTGVDFSDKAIKYANLLARKTNVQAVFICCNIYDLPNYLNKKFDIVFSSYGTIGWLPDLNRWAKIISKYLKSNGKFIFVEFHPFIWMFDDKLKNIDYIYFNSGPIVETIKGTYTDRNAPIKNDYICWNHSLSEVLNSLIKNGLTITSFDEFDYSPYNYLYNMEEFEPKKFRIKHFQNKIPMIYSIIATKRK